VPQLPIQIPRLNQEGLIWWKYIINEEINTKYLSVLKIDEKSPHWKARFKWEDNIKTDLQQKTMGADGKNTFWEPRVDNIKTDLE
jgi:hypothetical protein